MVEHLIAIGANVNARAVHSETPAHVAALMNRRETVALLISRGANISSIQLAAYLGDLAKVRGFLENGVRVEAQDGSGLTPLHAAAGAGQKEIAEFLIGRGASRRCGRGSRGARHAPALCD